MAQGSVSAPNDTSPVSPKAISAETKPTRAAEAPPAIVAVEEPMFSIEAFIQIERLEPFWQHWLRKALGSHPHTLSDWSAALKAAGRK